MQKRDIVSINGGMKKVKLSGFLNVKYMNVLAVIDNDTNNQMCYLPLKKTLAGKCYKKGC